MKKMALLILFIAGLFCISKVYADHWVNGYTRSDGTYVRGHYRRDPDGNFFNNYSSKGNYNPYTGEKGYRSYDSYLNDKYKQNNYNYDFNFGN